MKHGNNKTILLLALMAMSVADLVAEINPFTGMAFTSKWVRVRDLAKQVALGDPVYRLRKKDEVLAILYEQEAEYPVYYVNRNATGANNGSSWKDAYKDLQTAINKAADTEGWVWVAKGTYTGRYVESDYGSTVTVAAIKIKSYVSLFGGFAGNETSLAARDPETNQTIIQSIEGPGPKGPRAVDMNHYSLIDGFIIRNSGFKDYSGVLADYISGGGIRTKGWFTVIRNNRLYENHAKNGASIAVWNRYGRSNEVVAGYTPIIENNYIHENHANCGAVYLRNSPVLFCNNVVADNFEIPEGSEDRSKGVEMFIDLTLSSEPYVINNIIWNNTATSTFPDLYNHVDNPQDAKAISLYNCIKKKGYGTGLVTADPRFKNAADDDYTVLPTSPCIDKGHPDGPTDPDGSRADIGIYSLRYVLSIDDAGVGGNPAGAGRYPPGTRITISVDSLVVDALGTTRKRFVRWEGTGTGSYSGTKRTATVTMNGPISETVVWTTDYRLQVVSGTTADGLTGWYSPGTVKKISVPLYIPVLQGSRKRFLAWEGQGQYSVSGTDTAISIAMNGPVVETATWRNEHLLTLTSAYGSPVGGGWYSEGSQATFNITSPVEGGPGTRYVFRQWGGSGTGSYSGTNQSQTITVRNPITETAQWKTQYNLTLLSDYGNPQGSGWYDENAQALVTIESMIQMGTGSRRVMAGWEGQGTNAYTGPNPSFTVTLKSPVTESALWRMEYYLALSVEPAGGGTIVPVSLPGQWCIGGRPVSLRAVGNTAQFYSFTQWSGDVSSVVDSVSFIMQRPMSVKADFRKGNVIVRTVPEGLQFKADGAVYTGPRAFFWNAGSTRRLGVVSPQEMGNGFRYSFREWNNTPDPEQDVVVTDQSVTYTAFFDTSYRVAIVSEFGEGEGEGWYAPKSQAVLSIDSLGGIAENERQRFVRWTGTGNGSVTSTKRKITITVRGPIVQTVQWMPQYRLRTSSVPDFGGNVSVTPAGYWYDQQVQVTLRAIPSGSGVFFQKWSGDLASTSNPVTLKMDGPRIVSANFNSNTNAAPRLSALPDITLFEDVVYTLPNIQRYASDANDPLNNLVFSLNEGSHISVEFNKQASALKFLSFPDWNGAEKVVLKVTDPWQQTARDSFQVTVLPVNDPPAPFSLLWPPDGANIPDTSDHVPFLWQSTEDPDGPVLIEFEFFAGKDSLFQGQAICMTTEQDTAVLVNRNALLGFSYWGVRALDDMGSVRWCIKKFRISTNTSVSPQEQASTFRLYQNYPNPFNAETQITYELVSSGEVRVQIFDSMGRLVRTLHQGILESGVHVLVWNAQDGEGKFLPSGIYFVQVRTEGDRVERRKMLLIR